MTTTVTPNVLHEIDAEHQELEKKYRDIRDILTRRPARVELLRVRLAELATELKRHFDREEASGYFTEIIEMAPHLSTQAETLELEHGELLEQLQRLRARFSSDLAMAERDELVHGELPGFLDACRTHEYRETELVQEAWLTDLGAGG